MSDIKSGSAPIPCEIIRGIDGKLYLRSDWLMHIDIITTELNTTLCCVGGPHNGFCLTEIGENKCLTLNMV